MKRNRRRTVMLIVASLVGLIVFAWAHSVIAGGPGALTGY